MSGRSTPAAMRDSIGRLALARGLSIMGDGAAYVALVAAIAARTHAAIWISVAVLTTLGLGGAVSPLAGWLGDRFDRRRVMVVSDLASAACYVALALAHAPAALLAIAAIATIAQAPFGPASNAAVANLAGEERLGAAYGLLARAGQLGTVAGPLLGGVGIASVGASGVFVANAVTFAGSAALVATLPGRFQAAERSASHGSWHAGYRFIWASPLLRVLVPALLAVALAMGFLIPAEVALAKRYDAGTTGFGLIVTTWAVGAIVGAHLAGRATARRELHGVTLGGGALCIAFGVVSLTPWFPVALVAMVLGGGGQAFMLVAAQVVLQGATPDALRSRVSAVDAGLSQIAWAAGALGTGFVLGLTGPQALYGAVAAVVAIVLVAFNLLAARGHAGAHADTAVE